MPLAIFVGMRARSLHCRLRELASDHRACIEITLTFRIAEGIHVDMAGGVAWEGQAAALRKE